MGQPEIVKDTVRFPQFVRLADHESPFPTGRGRSYTVSPGRRTQRPRPRRRHQYIFLIRQKQEEDRGPEQN